jgi:hypothetical protein
MSYMSHKPGAPPVRICQDVAMPNIATAMVIALPMLLLPGTPNSAISGVNMASNRAISPWASGSMPGMFNALNIKNIEMPAIAPATLMLLRLSNIPNIINI